MAQNAQGASTQSMIDRGFYNSTVATDAGSAIAADEMSARNAIDMRAGQQKADITMGFAESAGNGGGYEALAAGLGQYLAARNAGASTGTQAQASQSSPTESPGGNYALNSAAYSSPYNLRLDGDSNSELAAAGGPLSTFSYASMLNRTKKRFPAVPGAGGSMP